ncbi:MAG: oligosaccharide flippase family protein [Candidatus Gribaldobacteria bacterium]|nr:oligosaccharide flippase family protein [Candidatus Gribaldobacteria bacterium]
MFDIIKKIKSDKFLSNSFIFFVGGFLVSLGSYLFQFLMVRLLSVESYGELQSLLAVSVIFGIPIAALSTVLIKYTARFKAKGENGKLHSLFSLFTNRMILAISIFSVIFFAFSGLVADFLKLNSVWPVIILGLTFIPTLLSSINRAVIQGLEKFTSISIIGLVEVIVRILLAFILVKIGLAVNGAIGAIALAGLVGYFFTFLPLKFLFSKDKKKEPIETKEIIKYLPPVFFSLLFLTLFYNIDIVLVKHFLPAYEAGQYGALALIGHIIFFITGPIVAVMFPMTSAAHANNANPSKIFKKTIALAALIGSAVLLIYFLLPELVIKILVGSKFLPLAGLLGWFSLAMFLYSLIIIFSQYFLSIHKTRVFYFLGSGVLLQTIFIAVWHQNLGQIVWAMNVAMLLTLGLLLVYYERVRKLENYV